MPDRAENILNPSQHRMYDFFIDYYCRYLTGKDLNPLFFNVNRPGGSGKTYMLNILSAYLQRLAWEHGRVDPVFRTAPTGVAANIINSQTFYLAL